MAGARAAPALAVFFADLDDRQEEAALEITFRCEASPAPSNDAYALAAVSPPARSSTRRANRTRAPAEPAEAARTARRGTRSRRSKATPTGPPSSQRPLQCSTTLARRKCGAVANRSQQRTATLRSIAPGRLVQRRFVHLHAHAVHRRPEIGMSPGSVHGGKSGSACAVEARSNTASARFTRGPAAA